jgi:hypothetical protein
MALTPEWFSHHRNRMANWHRDRLDEALEDIATMQREITELQQELAAQHDTTPTQITLTVS